MVENSSDIKNVQDRIKIKETDNVPSSSYLLSKIKEEIFQLIEKKYTEIEKIDFDLKLSPSHVNSDLTMEAFPLAKKLKKNPSEIADSICQILNEGEQKYIKSAQATGAYVNINLKQNEVYQEALSEWEKMANRFGESNDGKGEIILVDFSSVNVAKPFNVGHLRSTVIGQALVNIYEKCGYISIKDNHLGDWGTQFGALIYAYQVWGDKEKINQNPISELKDLYVKFHEEEVNHPEIRDEARKIFARLESGDAELKKLWQEFNELSIRAFDKIYKRLNISFDTMLGESFFNDKTEAVIKDCMRKKICVAEKGTKAISVNIDSVPSFLLQKEDGSSLYITRDLAAIKFRRDSFHPSLILYVVGKEQELHFKQLFELAKKLGYLDEETTAKHIEFGLVLSGGKKMSTRKGHSVELEDLIDQSIEKSKKILMEKNDTLSQEEVAKNAEIIGIGAIIYNDLSHYRVNDITFDWDKMLDFEGGSAAYLQYSVVRIKSILKKSGNRIKIDLAQFKSDREFALARKILFYPSVILEAKNANSPNLIANYIEELAALFNSFYNEIQILKTEEPELRESRLKLAEQTARVIESGLELLNIKVPEKM